MECMSAQKWRWALCQATDYKELMKTTIALHHSPDQLV